MAATDQNTIEITVMEIENLFLERAVHPKTNKGEAALKTLKIKHRRKNGPRCRGALFISIFALAIILLGAGGAYAEERYLCVAEQVTGFFYDAELQKWKPTQFNPAEVKYIIRPSGPENRRFEIVAMALDMVLCTSEAGIEKGNEISFSCVNGQFIFNQNTGRFIKSDILGYVGGDHLDITPGRHQTPNIAIGRCSPF
jgi:hypothetical protein